MVTDEKLKNCIQDVLLLSLFKSFCEKTDSKESRQRLRNIYSRSPNPLETTKNIMKIEMQEEISLEEAEKLYPMIVAFLNKNSFRKAIPDSIKKELLKKQNNRCAICGIIIDIRSHADHIVPFKYVGDELKDNYQMLCTTCNLKKNASIDYQMRFLLKSL